MLSDPLDDLVATSKFETLCDEKIIACSVSKVAALTPMQSYAQKHRKITALTPNAQSCTITLNRLAMLEFGAAFKLCAHGIVSNDLRKLQNAALKFQLEPRSCGL